MDHTKNFTGIDYNTILSSCNCKNEANSPLTLTESPANMVLFYRWIPCNLSPVRVRSSSVDYREWDFGAVAVVAWWVCFHYGRNHLTCTVLYIGWPANFPAADFRAAFIATWFVTNKNAVYFEGKRLRVYTSYRTFRGLEREISTKNSIKTANGTTSSYYRHFLLRIIIVPSSFCFTSWLRVSL